MSIEPFWNLFESALSFKNVSKLNVCFLMTTDKESSIFKMAINLPSTGAMQGLESSTIGRLERSGFHMKKSLKFLNEL